MLEFTSFFNIFDLSERKKALPLQRFNKQYKYEQLVPAYYSK